MKLSGKKLTTAILAGLMGATMFGGSVFAAVTDQEFNEVRQGVNANSQRLDQLESAQQQAKDYSKDIAANTTAIAKETTARTEADTKLDTRITNVKEYLEKQTAADYVSKTDATVQDAGVVKADKKIGENVTALGKGLYDETAARIGADAAQDKVIKGVNDNLVSSVNTINKNIGTITDQLNKNDLAEAQARDAADQTLQKNIDAEATARDAADQKLQGNIDAEAKARDAADQNLQANINNEAKLRDEADQNLQNNINNAVNVQAGINDTLTKAVTNNSKAIVANAEAAKNLEKHLNETDGRVDKANAEIHTNAGSIAQNKIDIAANKKAIGDEAAARESGDNALQNQIKKESAARQADISRLDNKIHDVSKEVDTVGALSMAMSGLHPLSYDEGDARFQLSAAVGTYDGTEALALGGFYHFNRDSMLSVGVATDLGADEHRMGANVGYTRRIGQGGHVSRPSEGTVSDIMKDIKNLEQKQAKLEQENEQLKQQLAALNK